jgi:hypothetical protein
MRGSNQHRIVSCLALSLVMASMAATPWPTHAGSTDLRLDQIETDLSYSSYNPLHDTRPLREFVHPTDSMQPILDRVRASGGTHQAICGTMPLENLEFLHMLQNHPVHVQRMREQKFCNCKTAKIPRITVKNNDTTVYTATCCTKMTCVLKYSTSQQYFTANQTRYADAKAEVTVLQAANLQLTRQLGDAKLQIQSLSKTRRRNGHVHPIPASPATPEPPLERLVRQP